MKIIYSIEISQGVCGKGEVFGIERIIIILRNVIPVVRVEIIYVEVSQ